MSKASVVVYSQAMNKVFMGTYMFCFPGSSVCKDFPRCSVCKESTCDAGDPGLIPRLQRSPGEGNGNPLQCYSPWGHKELDMTEAT